MAQDFRQKQHRSGFAIVMDIMNTISEKQGCKISNLGTLTNLSHYALKEKLGKMIQEGYVITDKETFRKRLDGTSEYAVTIFKLTTKGQEFLVAMNKYRETISRLGL